MMSGSKRGDGPVDGEGRGVQRVLSGQKRRRRSVVGNPMTRETEDEKKKIEFVMSGERNGGGPRLAEVLEDLAIRFVVNQPTEEFEQSSRIFFHIELAHWFYEDFYREQFSNLPVLRLREFAKRIFPLCPQFRDVKTDVDTLFADFVSYKIKIPVCGAVILNEKMDKCIMVKGWASRSTWGFPKGKINKNEREIDCCIREVLEETGFDVSPYAQEENRIEVVHHQQKMSLFVCAGVPEASHFEPQTRKEISEIAWHPVADLPSFETRNDPRVRAERYGPIYAVVSKLRAWVLIARSRRKLARREAKVGDVSILKRPATDVNAFRGQKLSIQDLFDPLVKIEQERNREENSQVEGFLPFVSPADTPALESPEPGSPAEPANVCGNLGLQ